MTNDIRIAFMHDIVRYAIALFMFMHMRIAAVLVLMHVGDFS